MLTSENTDYLLAHPTTQASSSPIIVLPVLWNVLMSGLAPIWPSSRTTINGVSLGDAWPCAAMPQAPQRNRTTSSGSSPPTFSPFPSTTHSQAGGGATGAWEAILPFHKLTQWLTYSLMQPMQSIMKIQFAGTELLTGLPEYRNGGLFIDLGVLTLKETDMERGLDHYRAHYTRTGTKGVEVAPMFEPGDDVIVEWRGVTVGFLDKLCADVNVALRGELQGGELTLAQLLEAGSWKVSLPPFLPYLTVFGTAPGEGRFRKVRMLIMTTTGRSRNRRSQPAEHERTADSHRFRWDRVLKARRRKKIICIT